MGDNAPYDLAVESGGHFLRVQVKCTQFRRGHSYKCHLYSNGVAYSSDQIDFIAAYIIPVDTWYILPVAVIAGHPDILLTPDRKNSKHARYKEAWHLLKSNAEVAKIRDGISDGRQSVVSREAAQEYSLRRKAWVSKERRSKAQEGRKKGHLDGAMRALAPNHTGKPGLRANFLLHKTLFLWYKQFTESIRVASRAYCLQLSCASGIYMFKGVFALKLSRPRD